MQHLVITLATYVWNKWNIFKKKFLQHTCIAIATSGSTFTTSIRNTLNIPLKHLKHLEHIFVRHVFSTTQHARHGELTRWRRPCNTAAAGGGAMARANPRGREWATAQGARSERMGEATLMPRYSEEYPTFVQKNTYTSIYIYVYVIVGFIILYFSSQNTTPIRCAGIHSHDPS
jgi:hypothetical protein